MKKIGILMVLIFCLINLASAIDIEINVQDSFSTEEMMEFNYTLDSEEPRSVSFIPHIKCSKAPVKPFIEMTEQLQPNTPYSSTYSDQVVKKDFDSQTCTAYVKIISPIEKTVSKNFSIKTNPGFDFSINLDKKVFNKNEEISMDYDSSVKNPLVSATLIYPDGSTEKIDLPTSINPSQTGTYTLEVNASKQEYKTIEESMEFGVIEKDVNIKNKSSIEPLERDFDFEEAEGRGNKRDWLLYMAGGLIILVFVIVFLLLRNRKKKKGKRR